MIYLRSFLFQLYFWIWSVFTAVWMLALLPLPRRFAVAALTFWSKGLFFGLHWLADIRIEVRGRDHLPTGPALVAAKHQSMFDVFSQFGLLPDACFVMKKELLNVPLFGWHGLKAGMVVVDRAGHATALRKLIRDSKERFADNRQLLIFPEGTRSAPGAPADYKPGIAALYREIDVPVHPVATNAGVHWPKHGFMRKPGTIVFEYLEPIAPGLKRAEFMRLLQDRIETASNKLLTL